MRYVQRPLPFLVVSTKHGNMIVNWQDYRMKDANTGYGVGFQLLNTATFDADEIELAFLT